MRFLGKVRIPKTGVDVHFNGEVNTKRLNRPEGVCIKHRLNRDTLKMYDKQGSVLRVETTINDTSGFGVHRASGQDSTGPKKRLQCRTGCLSASALHASAVGVSVVLRELVAVVAKGGGLWIDVGSGRHGAVVCSTHKNLAGKKHQTCQAGPRPSSSWRRRLRTRDLAMRMAEGDI